MDVASGTDDDSCCRCWYCSKKFTASVDSATGSYTIYIIIINEGDKKDDYACEKNMYFDINLAKIK
jgi:hypothetical protein